MVLDTGAAATLIPTRIANQLQLKTQLMVQMQSATGIASVPQVLLPEISIANLTVTNMLVTVYDMPKNGQFEGLLGLDFLNKFRMSIDSEAGVIHLDRK